MTRTVVLMENPALSFAPLKVIYLIDARPPNSAINAFVILRQMPSRSRR